MSLYNKRRIITEEIKMFLKIVYLVLGVAALFWIIGIKTAIDRSEKGECIYWQAQATRIPDYYIAHWQKSQCDYHNITINAPVE